MDKMKTKEKKKKLAHYLFISLFILAVVVLLFTVIVLGLYVYITYQKKEPSQKELYAYKSLDVKKYYDGEKSVCDNFITLNQDRLVQTHNELMLYDSMVVTQNSNEYSLISNFGADRYECTGTCICEDGRRSSSSTLLKGVSYFFVAMSTTLALSLARRDFHEVCVSEFSGDDESCHPNYVLSEVDSCSKLDDCTDTCTDYTQYEDQNELEIIIEHKPPDEDCTKKVAKGDTISVHYTGRLTNGKIFDSSVPRGVPLEFQVGVGVMIRGWDQGLIGACLGEKRRLIVPHHLGYGHAGVDGLIPKYAVLIFDIEVVEIKDTPEMLRRG